MNIAERIASDISKGKGPRISADEVRAAIRHVLVCGRAAWIVESAPHSRGGVAVTAALLQSIDDWGRRIVIISGGGIIDCNADDAIPSYAALQAALMGSRRPRVLMLGAEQTAGGWKIYLDGYEEAI